MRAKPKFRVGQVVLNCYYRDDYIKIRAKKFGAAQNNPKVWAYTNRPELNPVWFEETMLRPLTKGEMGL